MGFSLCERNGVWAHGFRQKSSYVFEFSIPRRPTLGVTLRTKKVKHNCVLSVRTRSARAFNVLSKAESANWSVSGELLEKDLEFKPSFEEYLKAMESVKTVREKKQTHSSKIHKSKNAEDTSLRDSDGHAQQTVTSQEGYLGGKIDRKERESRDLKDSKKKRFEENGNAKHALNSVEDELWGKGRRNGMNINWKLDMDTKKMRGVQESQWGNEKQGHNFMTNSVSLFKGTKRRFGLERNYSRVDRGPDEKIAFKNVKIGRRNKSKTEDVEFERAAFKSLEEFNDVVDKPRISRNEMEERIQKLARW